jgi:DUF438 domain-containing protein
LTGAFQAAIEHHFDMEEQVLFPAFEQQTGIVQGPTMMMRSEHQQMRGLLFQLKDAMERQEEEDFLDTTETLLIMMQQHNMKEEGILYPMSDEQLSDAITSLPKWSCGGLGMEIILDVRDLEPPEPYERATEVLQRLQAGQYVRMISPRRPRLLYPWLAERGFSEDTATGEAPRDISRLWTSKPRRIAARVEQ